MDVAVEREGLGSVNDDVQAGGYLFEAAAQVAEIGLLAHHPVQGACSLAARSREPSRLTYEVILARLQNGYGLAARHRLCMAGAKSQKH